MYRTNKAKEMTKKDILKHIWEKRQAKGETEFASVVDYMVGASDILALDLPVKFASWCKSSSYILEGVIRIKPDILPEDLAKKDKITTKELFDYWINNVYKFE